MNNFKFYYFKDLTHKQQPYNSKWYWAAYISSIIDSFNLISSVGSTLCNLASYYKKYRKNQYVIAGLYDECCQNQNNPQGVCNKGIEDGHISDIIINPV